MKRQNEREVTEPHAKKQKKEKRKEKKKEKKEQKQKQHEASGTFFKDMNQKDYFSKLKLKADHSARPCWVCPDHHIFLETFSPIYRKAYDFLVTIAEPVSRPEHIHEYSLTESSLYAAVSIGLETKQIIELLDSLSKTELDEEILQFIRECTASYGKVKLVLQKNVYYIESLEEKVLLELLRDPVFASARIMPKADDPSADPNTRLLLRQRKLSEMTGFKIPTAPAPPPAANGDAQAEQISKESKEQEEEQRKIFEENSKREEKKISQPNNAAQSNILSSMAADIESLDADEDELDFLENKEHKYFAFEIDGSKVGEIKKRCHDIQYPMLEEYDFNNDTHNPNLDIDLQRKTNIRPYQAKALSKMFSNGRARSGIIVLPCGAGKTLVGITSACTVKKSTLVLCISTVSVEQWRNQFKLWTTIDESRIARFTSIQKDTLSSKGADVVITTYSMITFNRERSSEANKIMNQLQKREWGLIILDEVHVVPAAMFRRVIDVIKGHCKLGLTATLLREDDKATDLYYLIGPKLYEANWLDLQRSGHLAKVQCVEVWCTMTPEFYAEYLIANSKKKNLLYVMNPNKYRACEFLVKTHIARGDKVIVFSDIVLGLQTFAKKMGMPFICGTTPQQDRMDVFAHFKENPRVNCVFVSKVGDTAIDLPEANVIVQISSHFGSRRQETQRLGRILRPKPTKGRSYLVDGGSANAFFYSLVSQDTKEMFYSAKRQQFLIDQGYSYQVINNLHEKFNDPEYHVSVTGYLNKQEELDLLAEVLKADDSAGENEKIKPNDDDVESHLPKASKRRSQSMSDFSGGSGLVYREQRAKKSASQGSNVYRHPLFKKCLRTLKK